MTGITAKRNSVSVPKTAVSCGLTHLAAIRRVSSVAGGPSAAIPETVIIGDRGILSQAANIAPKTASTVYTLFTRKISVKMTTKTPPSKPRRGKLKITQESVLRRIANYYELKGLDVAIEKFEQMNEFFSTEPGWDETAKVVTEYLIQKRKEDNQKLREEKLEEQRAAASRFVVVSKATSDAKNIGTAKIDKMDVDVKSPGNTIAKIIKLGKNNDDEN